MFPPGHHPGAGWKRAALVYIQSTFVVHILIPLTPTRQFSTYPDMVCCAGFPHDGWVDDERVRQDSSKEKEKMEQRRGGCPKRCQQHNAVAQMSNSTVREWSTDPLIHRIPGSHQLLASDLSRVPASREREEAAREHMASEDTACVWLMSGG